MHRQELAQQDVGKHFFSYIVDDWKSFPSDVVSATVVSAKNATQFKVQICKHKQYYPVITSFIYPESEFEKTGYPGPG